ncbi:MAG TPA: hypothetical protein VHZ30_02175 [Verrucomicrobiae bacterium]|nr:hypothetical protein [Verrucomicrobiae bacterium]
MTIHTETANRADSSTVSSDKTTGIDWAVFGCLVAGGVGIVKALNMERGVDVLACLLGSLAAFGVVFYVCLRKQ